MPGNAVERPQFYEGQYLGAADLEAVVEHARFQRARHDLGAHTWGIAAGLQLQDKELAGGQIDVYVLPGYAWDGFGRPIVVLAPYKLPAELFKSFVYDSTLDGGNPPGRLVEVWLRYDEAPASPPYPGFEICDPAAPFARVEETYRVEVGARLNLADWQDRIAVGDYSFYAQETVQTFDPQTPPTELFDESVAFQRLPAAGERRRWLIPLGVVRWLPPNDSQPGGFVRRREADLNKSLSLRRYIGVVAGAVQAADKNIRLRARTKPYSTVPSDDLVWAEGNLRVEGDTRLFGGKLEWLTATPQATDVRLDIRRSQSPHPNETTNDTMLQVAIGEAAAGYNRFSVGPLVAGARPTDPPIVDEKFVVLDNGRVGIGTTAPMTALHVPESGLQIGVSSTVTQNFHWTSDHNGGPQALRLYNGNYGSGTHLLTVLPNGEVGIGVPAPVSTLQIGGDVALQSRSSGPARALPGGATMLWNDGTWLRLNQNLDYTKLILGVHTPGLFAPGSLNVGGAGSFGDPGPGNVWIVGSVGIGTTSLMPQTKLQVSGGAITPAVGNSRAAGIQFPLDPGGGAWDEAYIRYYVEAGETTKLLIGCMNDADDTIGFYQFGAERLTIYDGKVGIGITNPPTRLYVRDSINADAANLTSYVAVLENISTGNNADVLALRIGSSSPAGGNNYITFFGGNNIAGRIEGDNGGIAYRSGSGDFAECLPRLHEDEIIEEGDIVGVFAGKITKVTEGAHHLMAITQRPVVVGNMPRQEDQHLYNEVAFIGQVLIKVRGAVQAGDYIVPAGLNDGTGVAVPSTAISPNHSAQIVGRAWQSSDAEGVKLINTAVGLQSMPLSRGILSFLQEQQDEIRVLKAEFEVLKAIRDTTGSI